VAKRGATIKDVARLAGVSIATVSNVVNGKRPVSEELRERVQRAIQQLKYRPSAAGRALRTGRSQSIGVLLPDPRNQFFQVLVQGLEEQAELHDNNMWCCNTKDDPSREREYIELMIARGVDGIIMVPGPEGRDSGRYLVEEGVPFVVVVRQIERFEADQVFGDSIGGSYNAIVHLVNLGHRRIGFLTGFRGIQTFKERLFGYQKALQDHGILFDPGLVVDGYSDVEESREAMRYLLKETDATAVLASNYPMAVGALRCLRDENVNCPDEFSIIGFDDLPCAMLFSCPLTVIDENPLDMGRIAGQLLYRRIEATDLIEPEPQSVVIPSELIVRSSTAGPPHRSAD